MDATHQPVKESCLSLTLTPLFLTIIFSLILPYQIRAQDEVTQQADEAYHAGRFRQALTLLEEVREEPETYRIRAFSYIALGEFADARIAVHQLIEQRPDYYSRKDDPVLFQQMVADAKSGLKEDRISSVSKNSEKLSEAPATVMVITAEDIRNRGYIDLEAFFSDLPGFDVSRTYGATYSNIYQRGYRSNNTDRTLFLLDGIEENDFWGSFPYWARQYPTTNVDRIEIIYGPASTMYGANAFLGVVNVITKDPFEGLTDDNPIAFTTETGVGSYNTRFAEAGMALKKKSIFVSATARGYFSDEHDLGEYEEYNFIRESFSDSIYAAILKVEESDTIIDKAQSLDSLFYLNGEGNRKYTYNNTLQHLYLNLKLKTGDFLMGFQTWKNWHGSLNYGNDNLRAPVDKANNVNTWQPEQSVYYINYEKSINEYLSLSNVAQFRTTEIDKSSTVVSLRNYSNGGLGSDTLVKTGMLEESIPDTLKPDWSVVFFNQKSKQFRNELRFNYAPNNDLSLVGGVEVKSSLIQGDYNTDRFITRDLSGELKRSESNKEDTINFFAQRNLGAYIQGTYAFASVFRLTLGGRLDYVQVRDSAAYKMAFNPRIALVVTPFRKEELVLKGIYATAFQEASIRDRYSTAAPSRTKTNPDLKPERVTNYEIAVNYREKGFQLEAIGYQSKYSNVIGQKDSQNQNTGERDIYGIQSSLTYSWNTPKIDYRFYANYNYTNPYEWQKDSVETRIDSTKVRVGDIALHRINIGVNATINHKVSVNLRMNFVGERKVGTGTTVPENPKEDGRFAPYTVLNSAVAYRHLIPGLDVQLVVNNLLNTEYFDPGIRAADGINQAFRTPQKRINGLIKFTYTLSKGK